jgi:uncharacterized integral membrane protein
MLKYWKKISGWQDAVELLVVVWVFVAPAVLGFFAYNAATLSAMLMAIVASITIQLGLAKQQPWEEWFNLSLAAFLAFSPWLFNYTHMAAATWNAIISGLVLAIFAILAMVNDYAQLRHMELGHKLHGPAA